jgi:hypothetical protein
MSQNVKAVAAFAEIANKMHATPRRGGTDKARTISNRAGSRKGR